MMLRFFTKLDEMLVDTCDGKWRILKLIIRKSDKKK